MGRLGLKRLIVVLLTTMILSSITASVLFAEVLVQAQLPSAQPGPLPAGVVPDVTVNTTAYLSFRPNPVGVGQVILVTVGVAPEPGPNRALQGFIVTITKPDGTTDRIGPLISYPGNGTTWFEYVVDQVGTWKLKLDFAGMYFPAGRYLNGQIITALNGTLYSESAYFKPFSTALETLTVQRELVQQGALQVSPASGPGGATVQFSGSGYPASSSVTISYYDQLSWKYWNSVTTNSSGGFAFSSEMPDLRRSLGVGADLAESYATLSFRAECAGSVYGTASYFEYLRGLRRVGNQTASGLFGNGTDLSYSVKVQAGDSLTITGKWFNPGVVYVRWDGVAVVGTVTGDEWRNAQIIGTTVADSTGYFETSVTIPAASVGAHFLAIEDSETTLITKVAVVNPASLQLSPSSGPPGVTVRFTGLGYPASAPVTISYRDPASSQWRYWTSVTTDVQGRFSFASEIPDLKQSVGNGDWPDPYFSVIYFRTESRGVIYSEIYYNEYCRGLKRIGSLTANGLYGNGTNLATYYGNGTIAQVKTGDAVPIIGKWFHPNDIVYVRWDGVQVVGTVTGNEWRNAVILNSSIADASGYFTTTVTIPNANPGEHYVAVEDSQAIVIVKVLISPGSLQISPSTGPGGTAVQFTGSGYPASSRVDISYLDPYYGTWKFWISTTADSSGRITLSSEIPDSMRSVPTGDYSDMTSIFSFRTEVAGSVYSYASFTQYWRGLKTVGSKTANGLFGNGTNLASYVRVKAGDRLTISGKWFNPGVVYVRWDGVAIVGTVTGNEWRSAEIIGTTIASALGSFEMSVTIPNATQGEHYIAIEDSQTILIIKVNYGPSYTPPPVLPQRMINVSCSSGTTVFGFKVEITGAVTYNNLPLSNQSVYIQYSVTGGASWQDLTFVQTGSDGEFLAEWYPSVTGIYMVRARCNAYLEWGAVSATTSFALTPASDQTVFSLSSNSTVSAFTFNSTSKELSFTVTGPSDTTGHVSVTIPKSMLNDLDGLNVRLDGSQVAYTTDSTSDSWIISVTYSHSIHMVVIELAAVPPIPEMPNEKLMAYGAGVVMAVAVSAGAVLKKKRASR